MTCRNRICRSSRTECQTSMQSSRPTISRWAPSTMSGRPIRECACKPPRRAPAPALPSPRRSPPVADTFHRAPAQFARESLDAMRGGRLEELLERHYHEIAHFKDIALDIDWSVYERAEELGKLR